MDVGRARTKMRPSHHEKWCKLDTNDDALLSTRSFKWMNSIISRHLCVLIFIVLRTSHIGVERQQHSHAAAAPTTSDLMALKQQIVIELFWENYQNLHIHFGFAWLDFSRLCSALLCLFVSFDETLVAITTFDFQYVNVWAARRFSLALSVFRKKRKRNEKKNIGQFIRNRNKRRGHCNN